MSHKIAINGFGRIGRMVFRILDGIDDLEVVAINDLTDPTMLAHLLEYDSVHRRYDADIAVEGGSLVVNGRTIRTTAERDPKKLDWGSLGVDVVMECTGVFRTGEQAKAHLDAGAKKVIISAPAKGIDHTIVVGVNDDVLDPAKHHIVSNGSCTTNCLAPVVKVIDDAFGVESGLMTTIHSYTNDQRLLDLPHSDKRRARAAALSMIPTSTGAAVAVGKVLPHLEGKLDGISVRVPTPNVSLVDVVLTLKSDATAESANEALKKAAEGPLKGILGFETRPLVSTDFIGDPRSSIVDAENTAVMGGRTLKVLSWYDNEWGFSNRMVDLTRLLLGLPRG
ncbi:MAG: type I glyceraldehyde-3-phosphate dehydrogenase [Myxococcales bacterium]|nr:type I glyceraldehyde-3-phosphate dehydrogenase [Myxococcales bacterium]MCB9535099.1 type I glyceraldehyde-3-phosphate dehydrogenase [Myxococcales bacterium]